MFCLPGCQNCQKRQNPLLAVLTFLAEGLEKTGGKHEDGSSHQGGGSNRSIHRGHGPKIQEAVAALEACGELPRNLRPVTRDRLILNWLTGRGYAADLPAALPSHATLTVADAMRANRARRSVQKLTGGRT